MSNNYGNTIKEKQTPASQSPQKQASPKQDVEKQQDAKVGKGAPSRSEKK